MKSQGRCERKQLQTSLQSVIKQNLWSCRLCKYPLILVFCAEFSLSTPWCFSKIDLNKTAQLTWTPRRTLNHISFKALPLCLDSFLEIVGIPMYLKIPHWSLTCSSINPWSGFGCWAAGCPEGSFGPSCRSSCQCQNGAACDHASGACTCAAGWTGTFCERGTDAPPGLFRDYADCFF